MLFIPVWDQNNLKKIPFQFVTVALVAVNIFIYFTFLAGDAIALSPEAIFSFAVIPYELVNEGFFGRSGYVVIENQLPVPDRLTLISYMFMHGSFMHLLGNMAFLWVFGDNVEDAMGHLRFFLFYIMCGVAAGLTHALILPDSPNPLIGASGAVSGVIAAYLMLHPRVRLWVLVLPFIPIRINAGIALGLWIGFQILSVITDTQGNTAWWAHIGGLVAGAILILFMRRPDVPLFDRQLAK